MISVALCTYNGAEFIKEQLFSIINQTRKVDEIIVCDDGSTDDTINIVSRIAESSIVPIYVYINEINLGCLKNFEKAIKLCAGDIVFLSDQDDIWKKNKVEVYECYLKQNPGIDVVFGDAFLIDEHGNKIMNSQIPYLVKEFEVNKDRPILLWECSGFSKLSQKQFDAGFGLELWLQMNRATGCTMAFRSKIIDRINFNPSNSQVLHDCILSLYGIATNTINYIKEPLIQYRQHKNNVLGCDLISWKNRDWFDARFPCDSWADFSFIDWSKNHLNRIHFSSIRYNYIKSLFGISVVYHWLMYVKTYNKYWLSFLLYDYRKSLYHSYKIIRRYCKKKLSYIHR